MSTFILLGLKPYMCSICHQAYSRTSERSRCMKKHHFEDKYLSEQDKQCLYKDVYNDWDSSGLSALQIEDKINQSRPRPYICQICNDHRAYTDPSSLRKHMRSYHAHLKDEKSITNNDSTNESVMSKSKLSVCLKLICKFNLFFTFRLVLPKAKNKQQLGLHNFI